MTNSIQSTALLLNIGQSDKGATNQIVKPLTISWDDLIKRLKKLQRGPKDGSYFTRCAFVNDHRGNANAKQIDLVILDGDQRLIPKTGEVLEGAPPPELVHEALTARDITHAIVPSYSNFTRGDSYHKYRVIIPAQRINASELTGIVAWLIDLLNKDGVWIVNVKENKAVSQPWYWPRTENDKAEKLFRVLEHDGGQNFPEQEALAWWNEQLESHKQIPTTDNITPLGEREGIIADILGEHNSATHLLSLLIQNDYTFSHQGGMVGDKASYYLTAPESLSRTAGVRIFFSVAKGVWVAYSHHTHGVLADGHAHDYLSLVTTLRHGGNLKAALASFGYGSGLIVEASSGGADEAPTPTPKLRDKAFDRMFYVTQQALIRLLGEDGASVANEDAYRHAWDKTVFDTAHTKFGLINKFDSFIVMPQTDMVNYVLHNQFGSLLMKDLLDELIEAVIDPGKEAFEMSLTELTEEKRKAAIEDRENVLTKPRATLQSKVAFVEHEYLIREIKMCRQIQRLSLYVDMFAFKGRLICADQCATVVYPHVPFTVTAQIPQAIVADVVADYREHFPEFDALVSMMIYSRFASDRRRSFVWLTAGSDWGKGLLIELFKRLGLVFEVSSEIIESVMAGKPVGLDASDVLRAWIMSVDEVKFVSRELKMLNSSMRISPKFQLTTEVNLYVKLFTSAEDIKSLTNGGVEDQFDRRFSIIDCKGLPGIDKRPVWQRLGKTTYINALLTYLANHLNEEVRKMRMLGAVEASRISDEKLDTYQSTRRLSAIYGALNDALPDIAAEIKDMLFDFFFGTSASTSIRDKCSNLGISTKLGNALTHCTFGYYSIAKTGQRVRAIVLPTTSAGIVGEYLENSSAMGSLKGKFAYKEAEIMKLLGKDQSEPVRLYACKERLGRGHTQGKTIARKRGTLVLFEDDYINHAYRRGEEILEDEW